MLPRTRRSPAGNPGGHRRRGAMLARDNAAALTGQKITADGGLVLR